MKFRLTLLSIAVIYLATLCLRTAAITECNPQLFEEGEEATLPCMCETDIKHTRAAGASSSVVCQGVLIRWFYGEDFIGYCIDGQIVLDPPYDELMTIASDEALVITRVAKNNTGLYVCQRTTASERHQFLTEVEVYVPPKKIAITEMQDTIAEGEPVTVECVITRVYPAAAVSAQWIYPSGNSGAGQPLITDNADGTQQLTYLTEITLARDDHDGDLKCCADWFGSPQYACDAWTLQVHHAPTGVNISSNLTSMPHKEGSAAEIRCTVIECYPVPMVTLHKDGSDTEFTGYGMQVHFEVTLDRTYNQIPLTCCATADDAFRWIDTCSADELLIEVYYPLTVNVLVDDNLTEGDNVTVECDARGGNPPEIDSYHWEFYPKYDELDVEFVCHGRQCVIEAVGPEHSGIYNCTASNFDSFYKTWNTANMTVKYKPLAASDDVDIYGALGDNITLVCTMAALPYDDVTFNWTHTGENGTIFLGSLKGITLETETVNSNITLTNLTMSSYGVVNCTGTNVIGTGQPTRFHVLRRGPPGIPVDFSIDDVTAVSVWLSWNSSHDGGSPQHFVVFYREVCDNIGCGEFMQESTLDDPGLNVKLVHKVVDLNDNTEYEFKVMAINYFNGTGGNSSSTDNRATTTTARPHMKDGAKEPTIGYNSEAGVAVFAWELPENGSGCYTEQQIGRETGQKAVFVQEYDHCGTIYDCYSVGYSDTSAVLSMSKEEFDSSQFDHLLLQLDDVVLVTPFTVTGANGGLTSGEIAAIVLGVLLFIALIAVSVLLWMLLYHSRKKESENRQDKEGCENRGCPESSYEELQVIQPHGPVTQTASKVDNCEISHDYGKTDHDIDPASTYEQIKPDINPASTYEQIKPEHLVRENNPSEYTTLAVVLE